VLPIGCTTIFSGSNTSGFSAKRKIEKTNGKRNDKKNVQQQLARSTRRHCELLKGGS
jgi:hypothetical protein